MEKIYKPKNRPERDPDLTLYHKDGGEGCEKLEIWVDEMIDCWTYGETEKDISKIKIMNSVVLYYTGDNGWMPYDELDGFAYASEEIIEFMTDNIILGGYMTDLQRKFVEMDKRKAEYKEFMKEYRETVNQLKEEMGIGGHFQDVEGTVYQVEDCEGKFTYFDKYEVKRTRRTGERNGTLSLTKARDLGYEVE